MIRRAAPEDAAAIRAFLAPRSATSMFLMSNLEAHGVSGGSHPHATRFLLSKGASGLRGVFSCTRDGYLMCQHPGIDAPRAQSYLDALGPQQVLGVTGEAGQIEPLVESLRTRGGVPHLDRVEPLFTCALDRLRRAPVTLRAPRAYDAEMLREWFAAYLSETGLPAANEDCARYTRRAIDEGDTRLILGPDSTPLGMTSLNARAARVVQIGGVWIRPEYRGQGHAGRMVAAHLIEERAKGAETALLFAASRPAVRAYERIGFRQVGQYCIAMLRAPLGLGVAA